MGTWQHSCATAAVRCLASSPGSACDFDCRVSVLRRRLGRPCASALIFEHRVFFFRRSRLWLQLDPAAVASSGRRGQFGCTAVVGARDGCAAARWLWEICRCRE